MSTRANMRQLTPEGLQAVTGALGQIDELLSAQYCTTRANLRGAVSDLEKLERLLVSSGPESHLNAFRYFLDNDPRLDRLKFLVEEKQGEFNLFEVLAIDESERVHSNFLAWLLNPCSNDAIGSSFLKTFLERTVASAKEQGIPTVPCDNLIGIDWSETEVHREWNYIDILILNRKAGLVCAIENKINADEGFDEDGRSQLTRYRETLDSEFPGFGKHRVFLSPSGLASKSSVEQKFWVPEDYSTIHHLVVEALRKNADTAKPEVFWFVSQYESTLRRNIVPETGEIAKLANQIYLEHREAIELIYQHKPDYPTHIKRVIKEAIGQQEGWLLDKQDERYVRFRPVDWDKFEVQSTGIGWEGSTTLLLFEFNCAADPLWTRVPYLVLGAGTDKNIRRELFETARQNPKIFDLRPNTLSHSYVYLHDRRRSLLDESDLGVKWSDGTAQTKLTEWVERFAKNEFPLINKAIIGCFDEFEASLTEQDG